MKIDTNLLAKQSWTGTFFPPSRRDLSFGGRLSYLPTDGARLEYAIPIDLDFGSSYDHLHGELSDATPCTLVGKFDKQNGGLAFNNAGEFFTGKKYPFRYVLFGAHLAPNDTYDTFNFNITCLQDFFSPAPDHVPYQKMPVVSATIAEGTIEVGHSTSGEMLPRDLRRLLIADDKNALDKLQAAYDAIRRDHPKFWPVVKKSLEFGFSLKPTSEMEIIQAFRVCHKVADLFALLFFSPAKLTRFEAIARDQEQHAIHLPVFPSTLAEPSTIERSLTRRNYHQLPLNHSDLDLAALLQNWMTSSDDYASVTSRIQGQGHTVTFHDIYSSIVLSVAQLEDMDGVADHSKRYEQTLATHASQTVRERLCSLLGCASDKLGKSVADLRNEIAHLGRHRTILPALDTRQLHNVSHLLEVVVASYALGKVGLSQTAQEKYQNYWATRGSQ